MRRFFMEYFCFTKSERNGTFVLVVIMLMVYGFPYVYNALKDTDGKLADSGFIESIRAFYEIETGLVAGAGPDSIKQPVMIAGRQNERIGNLQTRVRNPVDINSADTAMLMEVWGIGPVLSRRILRYRDILGGYHDLLQLMEVYGIDRERYMEIYPSLYTDTALIIKLKVNTDAFSVLLRHPYIDYAQTGEIFRLREKTALVSPEDLLQSPHFSEEDITRLTPYLEFQ